MVDWLNNAKYTGSEAVDKMMDKLRHKRAVPRVNLPALARRDTEFMTCWEADPGTIFVSSDFSSLEPSVTAHFSQDPYYMYATYGGIGKEPYVNQDGVLMIDDIYLMTASVFPELRGPVIKYFQNPANCRQWVKDSEVCKEDPIIKAPRKKAKPACLGFNYGMGPKRFVNQCYDAGINITHGEAKAMYKAYWSLFKGIKLLTAKLEKLIDKQKFIENPFGYRLTTEPYKGYNAFIQSSASGVVDVFNLKFFTHYPDAKFIALIHDESIYQIPEDKLEEARKIQQMCVDSLNEDLQFSIPMRLGFTPGKTFMEFK
jgi:DNA polymerase I-like protein with 3'-5' exonuclease and polymerase domains